MKDNFEMMVSYLKDPSKVRGKSLEQNVRALNKIFKPASVRVFKLNQNNSGK